MPSFVLLQAINENLAARRTSNADWLAQQQQARARLVGVHHGHPAAQHSSGDEELALLPPQRLAATQGLREKYQVQTVWVHRPATRCVVPYLRGPEAQALWRC